MTSLYQDINDKLKRLNIFEKIILVNVVVYLIGWFIDRVYNGSMYPRGQGLSALMLPKDAGDFIAQPWSLITYGFTHADLFHIFFNLLVLYFIGRTFSNLFSNRISLSLYFLGIISGGILFLLIYNLFPNGVMRQAGPLLGASAGVRATLLFICAYMPEFEMRFARFRVKLLYFGILLVILDIPGLFGSNAGGSVAHFGGYVIGVLYAWQLRQGNDIGAGFGRVLEQFFNWFKWNSGPKLKKVHRSKSKSYAGRSEAEFREFNKQKRIDLILDKISKSGYDSLTQEEKDFLFRSGKD